MPLESASIGYNYYRVDAQGNIMPSLEKISSFWETRSISETVFGSNFSRLKEKERAFPRLRDRFNEKVRILENSWARFRAIYSALSQEQQKQVKDTFSTANINFDSPTYPGETEGSSSIPNISQLKDGLNFATVE